MQKLIIPVLVAAGLFACSKGPYATANSTYKKNAKMLAKQIRQQPEWPFTGDSSKKSDFDAYTVNFNLRKPNYVIIHHTAQSSCTQTLQTFTIEKSQVSAHYVICKDGTIHAMLNPYLRAWHAGAGKWGNNSDINSSSIGIELDNNGTDSFPAYQITALEQLLAYLKKEFSVPTANFIGHADIAPTRKIDPNVYFPWKHFAEKGYGYWYSDTTNVQLPEDFNSQLALRIIGYDVSNVAAATEAFRRHFLSVNAKGDLTMAEKKVLWMVMKKFL